MSGYPEMTFTDRRYRQLKMRRDYKRGMSSREVAAKYDMSDSYVRSIMRAHGIARQCGRPGK